MPLHRKNFDWSAECGVYVCVSCGWPCYPMELEHEEGFEQCAECGATCHRATPEEIAAALAVDVNDINLEDWQYEVANGDTRLGFAEWQAHRDESDGCDEPRLRELELP